MQQKVKLPQMRNLGDIIDDSILFFKQNWKQLFKSYFTICGFFWVAGIIISIFNQTKTFQLEDAGESVFSLSYFLTAFFSFINIVLILLTTLSFIALYHEKGNQAPAVQEVWGYVKYFFLRLFAGAVLLTILCATGIVLCVLPGIYLMPVFLLVIAIMILENTSLGYAFKRSFQLIKDNWWHTFGVLMVMLIILIAAIVLFIIPVIIIVTVLLYLTTVNRQHVISMVVTIAAHTLQLLYLLPTISLAFIYFNLNEIKDDNGLMQRIDMLGKRKDDVNQPPLEEY